MAVTIQSINQLLTGGYFLIFLFVKPFKVLTLDRTKLLIDLLLTVYEICWVVKVLAFCKLNETSDTRKQTYKDVGLILLCVVRLVKKTPTIFANKMQCVERFYNWIPVLLTVRLCPELRK